MSDADKSLITVTVDDLDRAPESLPASINADQIPEQVMRERFQLLADENSTLRDDLQKLKQSANTRQILDSLLEPYADKAYRFMCAYCAGVGAILLLSGFRILWFSLDAHVLGILAGSTAVTVIGLVGMVLTGIFIGARKH